MCSIAEPAETAINLVSFPDPTTHVRKRVWGHWSVFLVLRTITWPHVLQYKPMQIITWLLSLQNQESAPMSPDPFLVCVVESGNETTINCEKFSHNAIICCTPGMGWWRDQATRATWWRLWKKRERLTHKVWKCSHPAKKERVMVILLGLSTRRIRSIYLLWSSSSSGSNNSDRKVYSLDLYVYACNACDPSPPTSGFAEVFCNQPFAINFYLCTCMVSLRVFV